MEVHPQLHLIDTGVSNVYLCLDDDGLTVVDAGIPRRAGKILDYIRSLGRDPAEVKRILITHVDLDHVGSLAALQAATGARVYANRASLDLIVRGELPAHLPLLAELFVSLIGYDSPPDDALVQFRTTDRLPVLNGVIALSTAGHTLDHVSYYSPSTGIMIAGDALNQRGGKLALTARRITADVIQAEASARVIAQHEPSIVVFGHGRPLKGEGRAIKEQILALLA